jgi:DNA-binding NarL/FixJ family response regulator
LAVILATDGQLEQAAHLMALAEWFEELTGAPLTPHIRHDHHLALCMLVDAVGAERFAAIQALVRKADPAAGITQALALTRHEPSPRASHLPGPGLTPRERDVLRMIAAGRSNQDIANDLFIGLGTVKVHVSHILAKLEVNSRAAAADYAHRHDLA